MRHPGVNRGQFFEKLHDIFPPSIGSSNTEEEANMVEVVYQASLPRFDPPRAAGRTSVVWGIPNSYLIRYIINTYLKRHRLGVD